MIDHMGVGVKDYERSREFYRKTLLALGYKLLQEIDGNAGFGTEGLKCGFWISKNQKPSIQVHFCFRAPTREAVRAFFEAALAAGGKEETPPGVVEEYHPSYYAAFVFDPDGYKIEALCLEDESL
jgi:catechol 2,3-dioxygenase-like lactoylglutathione lyase family enzyme